MLSKNTVRQFVFQSLIIAAFKNGQTFKMTGKTVEEIEAESAATADQLCADMPYDDMCNMFIEQLKELHAIKLPGVAKIYLASKASQEDPERFAELAKLMENEDIG